MTVLSHAKKCVGLWFLLFVACRAGAAQEVEMLTIRDGELVVVVGEKATMAERRAAELLTAEIARRSGLTVPVQVAAGGRYTLMLGTRDSSSAILRYCDLDPEGARLGEDGFHIQTDPDRGDTPGALHVVGQSPSAVVAGAGKLLRMIHYHEGEIEIPVTTVADAPRMPVRGIYFATHFRNFYHVAPLEEIDGVIENFALWGGNHLTVWFDMHHFQGFDDPAAQEHLARLQHFGETARSLGMKFGLGFLANEGYDSSPEHLRADPNTGTAHYRRELCPSKPEALELIGKWQAEVLDAFTQVDFIWSWPYDQGGCACDECAPWGANGFLRASEQLSRLYHERFPGGELWLSTWLMDQVNARGELDGLLTNLDEHEPDWLDGVVIGTHGDWIPQPLLERPHPDRYPLAAFPEISMYQMGPWGEHGANPLPGFCTRLADELRGNIVGGWPYSEGIYEDLNKFYFARFFWDPDTPTDDILADYASYYLSPEVSTDAVRLFRLMEQTHRRRGWQVASLDAADKEWALAQRIDERLPPWARKSWRWRILYIRAAIDGTLKAQGFMAPEAQETLKRLADELVRIYHAQNTFIAPPALPDPADPRNLAFGRPVSVSSSLPDYKDRSAQLVDGILAQFDGENFWCHDRAREETAYITVDLGEAAQVGEVRLQFRGIHGVFWFVPESVAVQVSSDGDSFDTVIESRDVPSEGEAYTPDLWAYEVGREARCVRLLLGKSQHAGDQYAGIIELTEVEVHSE